MQFKFIINEIYVLSHDYDICYDKSGIQNNIFRVNLSGSFSINSDKNSRNCNSEILCNNNLQALRWNNQIEKFPGLTEILLKKGYQKALDSQVDNQLSEDSESCTTELDEILLNHSINSPIKTPFNSKCNVNDSLYSFNYGVFSIGKEKGCSEDAYFASKNALGISDGVGGWSNYGLSASDFSNSLMKNCMNILSNKKINLKKETLDSFLSDSDNKSIHKENIFSKIELETHLNLITPEKILKEAYSKVHAFGSATALICILKDNQLSFTNIGDSKLMIIKMEGANPKISFASKEQQHDFNTPFQLAKIPTKSDLENLFSCKSQRIKNDLLTKIQSGMLCSDDPEKAECYQLNVKKNDLIILGTDGLFDNLYEDEILTIIKAFFDEQKEYSDMNFNLLAEKLGQQAKEKSISDQVNCPFNDHALQEAKLNFIGGKKDDISVIVARIEIN